MIKPYSVKNDISYWISAFETNILRFLTKFSNNSTFSQHYLANWVCQSPCRNSKLPRNDCEMSFNDFLDNKSSKNWFKKYVIKQSETKSRKSRSATLQRCIWFPVTVQNLTDRTQKSKTVLGRWDCNNFCITSYQINNANKQSLNEREIYTFGTEVGFWQLQDIGIG